MDLGGLSASTAAPRDPRSTLRKGSASIERIPAMNTYRGNAFLDAIVREQEQARQRWFIGRSRSDYSPEKEPE